MSTIDTTTVATTDTTTEDTTFTPDATGREGLVAGTLTLVKTEIATVVEVETQDVEDVEKENAIYP